MTREPMTDDEFERSLLRSARDDGPPAGATEQAWATFAASAASVAAASRPATPGSPQPDAGPPAGAAARATATSASSAARWVLLGALGGSAVTAAVLGAWTGPTRPTVPLSAPSAAVVTPAATLVGRAASPVDSAAAARREPGRMDIPDRPVVASPSSPGEVRAVHSGPALAGSARGPQATGSAPGATPAEVVAPGEPAPAPRSTLAEEVALIDRARVALQRGAPAEALARVDDHAHAFPHGELAPDAEAIAIEALVARGDRDEAARRARRFLALYPRDPSAARVRQLVAR